MFRDRLVELSNTRKLLTYITSVANANFCSDEILDELINIRFKDRAPEYQQVKYSKDFLRSLGCFQIKSDDEWISLLMSLPRTPLMKNMHFSTPKGDFLHKNRFTMPIKDPLGNVITWVSYKKGAAHKYLTSNTFGFSKEVSFYGDYLRAKQLGYVIVVEGMFDKNSLEQHGYPVLGIMGLELNSYRRALLNEIGFVIFIRDNDRAGKTVIASLDLGALSLNSNGAWKVDCDSYDYVLEGVKDIDEFMGNAKNVVKFENDIRNIVSAKGLEFRKFDVVGTLGGN